MLQARCHSKHVWPLLNYCLPCERYMQYKLFTKTLQIKRAEGKAKYFSKDPWEKCKLRCGTSPVHSYYPMQTCDNDYWPKQARRQAKDKLKVYDRCKDALEAKMKEASFHHAQISKLTNAYFLLLQLFFFLLNTIFLTHHNYLQLFQESSYGCKGMDWGR
jgi:hypothetical protein